MPLGVSGDISASVTRKSRLQSVPAVFFRNSAVAGGKCTITAQSKTRNYWQNTNPLLWEGKHKMPDKCINPDWQLCHAPLPAGYAVHQVSAINIKETNEN
jgi:hypothetical protein